ncbi:MAG: GNAT family N-acetyltransferase [Rhodospirillales bacterium]|nr:GNAT family N-acetyltransferase [Rhodospirillales bacterium]
MASSTDSGVNQPRMDAGMPDYSDPNSDDFEALSRDRVLVRSMREDDLNSVVRIDAKLTGHDRRDYFTAKLKEVMSESGVRVSLVAEVDNMAVGFIMARVDFGEFGQTEAAAVIDTLGVNPDHGKGGIASALTSQLLINLEALHVENVRTSVGWNNLDLIGFLSAKGFTPAQQLTLVKKID